MRHVDLDKLPITEKLCCARVLNSNEDLVVWSEGEIIDGRDILTGETFTQRHYASRRKKSGDIFEDLLYANYIFGSKTHSKKRKHCARYFTYPLVLNLHGGGKIADAEQIRRNRKNSVLVPPIIPQDSLPRFRR
jgi:hypothetical protein